MNKKFRELFNQENQLIKFEAKKIKILERISI